MASRSSICRAPRQLPDTLDVAQVEALLEAPAGKGELGLRDRALLELLYACGLRVSEALNLDLEDIALSEGVRVIGKGDRERRLPVGDVALAALTKYVDEARPALIGRRPTPAACAPNPTRNAPCDGAVRSS